MNDFAKKPTIDLPQILRNYASLTAGKAIGDLFTFALFVIISRKYGQDGLGEYSFAMAFTGFFIVFADFGLYNFSIKELSQLPNSLEKYFGKIIIIRLLLSAIVSVVLLFTLIFLPFEAEAKYVIAIIGSFQIIYTLINGWNTTCIANEDMHIAAMIEISLRLFILLASSVTIFLGGSLIASLQPFPIIALCHLLLICLIVRKRYGSLIFFLSWAEGITILKRAIPYSSFMFLRQLSTRLDIILLGFFLGTSATGIYNAAYRVAFMLIFLSYFAGLAIFPAASKLYLHSRQKLILLYQSSLNIMVIIGIPISFGLWLIAPHLTILLFGEKFLASISILRLLAIIVFLAFIKSIMGIFLTSCDRQTGRAKGQLLAAVFNLGGNLLLIPWLGVQGAAIATIISETILVSYFMTNLHNILGWPQIVSRMLISLFASTTFCLLFICLHTNSLWIIIPGSILIYIAIIVSFSEIRKNELKFLLGMITNKTLSLQSRT